MPTRHKYRAVPRTVDGIRFASTAESKRFEYLKLMELAGEITDLELQPRYELLPKMEGQRAIYYVADFRYREHGKIVVEDVKGCVTQAAKIKHKLFRAKYADELRLIKLAGKRWTRM